VNKKLKNFLEKSQLKFIENTDLSKFSTFHVNSFLKTAVFIDDIARLAELISVLSEENLDYFLLGRGSNIAGEEKIEAIAIIVRAANIKKISENRIFVEAGCSNFQLLDYCLKNELTGMEFLAGIPGTIGGAAIVNAGAMQKSISELIEELQVIHPQKGFIQLGVAEANFEYRQSRFKLSCEVLSGVSLKLFPGKSEEIKLLIRENINYRRLNHPDYRLYTAGCFFKNPLINNQRLSAGKLLTESGCREIKTKNFFLSNKHANFIVNRGPGKLSELKEFEEMLRRQVKLEKGIILEREVIYIDHIGKKY